MPSKHSLPSAIGRSSTRRRISRWAWRSRRRKSWSISSGARARSRARSRRRSAAEVANEIGDVLIYLLRLSRTLDIDLVAAATGQARAQPREVSGREGEGTRDEVRRFRLSANGRSGGRAFRNDAPDQRRSQAFCGTLARAPSRTDSSITHIEGIRLMKRLVAVFFMLFASAAFAAETPPATRRRRKCPMTPCTCAPERPKPSTSGT